MTLLAKLVKQHHRGEIEKVKLQKLRRFRKPYIIIEMETLIMGGDRKGRNFKPSKTCQPFNGKFISHDYFTLEKVTPPST